jgi:hypothetical protein
MKVRGGNPATRLKKASPPLCVDLIASRISFTDDVVFNVLRRSEFESDPVSAVAVVPVAANDDGDSKLDPPSLETLDDERHISRGGGDKRETPWLTPSEVLMSVFSFCKKQTTV